MDEESPPPPEKQYEILNDGKLIPLDYEDGRTEMIKVWKLAYFNEIPAYAQVLGNDLKEMMAVSKRDEAWCRSLTDESKDALIEEGRTLNFTRSANWLKRNLSLVKAIGKGGDLEKLVDRVAEKLAAQQR